MVAMGSSEEIFSIDDLLDFANDEAVDDASVKAETDDVVPTNDDKPDGGSDRTTEKLKGKAEVVEEPPSGALADVSLYGDLCEPPEQLAELEWVSNFLDDTLSPEDTKNLQLIKGTQSASLSHSISTSNSGSGFDSGSFSSSPETITLRRDRRRSLALNSWSSSVLTDTEPVNRNPGPFKRKVGARDEIRCTHCGTDKTPQWRSGPSGPKTLCNACGVRYKSGRLMPEYRPAASPTFVEWKHSNSHKKVMELRNKNTMMKKNRFDQSRDY